MSSKPDRKLPNMDHLDGELAAVLTRVCQAIAKAGGRAWLVGGVVPLAGNGGRERDWSTIGIRRARGDQTPLARSLCKRIASPRHTAPTRSVT